MPIFLPLSLYDESAPSFRRATQKLAAGNGERFFQMDSTTLGNVAADVPLRLSVAAKLAFPDGSMTVSGLRREAARGRLRIERIAGKDFTTLEEIKRMRELCRVEAKEPGCTGKRHDIAMGSSSPKAFGSSKTEAAVTPQDALRARLKQSRPETQSKP
jgi:hypothetical protein